MFVIAIDSQIFMDFETNLNDTEIQEFKEAFSILDKNGKGRITISELSDFLRSLGEIDPTDDEIKELIKVDIEQKVITSQFLN